MKTTICLIFGLPGVGKTSICRRLLENKERLDQHKCVFSFDKLMPKNIVFEDDDGTWRGNGTTTTTSAWKEYREKVIHYIETSIQILSSKTGDAVNINPGIVKSSIAAGNHIISKNEKDTEMLRNFSVTEMHDKLKNIVLEITKDSSLSTGLGEGSKNKHSKVSLTSVIAEDMCFCFQNDASSCDSDIDKYDEVHHVLFVDDNLFYRSMRYKFYQLARQYGCSFCQINLCAPLNTVLEQNSARAADFIIPRDTILKMNGAFETPDAENHPWEQNTLVVQNYKNKNEISQDSTIDIKKACSVTVKSGDGFKQNPEVTLYEGLQNNNSNKETKTKSHDVKFVESGIIIDQYITKIVDEIQCFVDDCSTHIVPPLLTQQELKERERARMANLENYVHRCDQLLRRVISNKMQEAKTCMEKVTNGSASGDLGVNLGGCPDLYGTRKKELHALAKRLNGARKNYLDKLRGIPISCDEQDTGTVNFGSTFSDNNNMEMGSQDWSEQEVEKFEQFLVGNS